MTEALMAAAPGQQLRAGLDRILLADRGALIVVGDGPAVLAICSGGFLVDAEYSPQRLSELAKMDGALILAADGSRIARANVHLVPDPSIPTGETGTRHRTAERVARSIDVPVISVSEDFSTIAVYRGNERHQLRPIADVIDRANQALATLERYKHRLDRAASQLLAREIGEDVSTREVAGVLQRAEMVRRIAEEVESYLVELGDDGRMLQLQLEELMGGVDDERRMLLRDYLRPARAPYLDEALDRLAGMATSELSDVGRVARELGLGDEGFDVDSRVVPRGYRVLARLLASPSVLERVLEHFGSVEEALRSSDEELASAAGLPLGDVARGRRGRAPGSLGEGGSVPARHG